MSGIAAFPEAGATLMDELRVADALYRAEDFGRNKMEVSGATSDAHADCEKATDEAVAKLGEVLEKAKEAETKSVGGKKSNAA